LVFKGRHFHNFFQHFLFCLLIWNLQLLTLIILVLIKKRLNYCFIQNVLIDLIFDCWIVNQILIISSLIILVWWIYSTFPSLSNRLIQSTPFIDIRMMQSIFLKSWLDIDIISEGIIQYMLMISCILWSFLKWTWLLIIPVILIFTHLTVWLINHLHIVHILYFNSEKRIRLTFYWLIFEFCKLEFF
jgi:hypothetical protein